MCCGQSVMTSKSSCKTSSGICSWNRSHIELTNTLEGFFRRYGSMNEAGRQYAMRGVQLWRLPGAKSPVEDLDAAAVSRHNDLTTTS